LKSQPLFVDTSAWIALTDVSDNLNTRASEFWRELLANGRSLVTSNYVLDETYTLLRRRRNGLKRATILHDLVKTSAAIEEAEIGGELRAQAWELFVGYSDKVLSFTDCTSFALMKDLQILEVFTFDGDFQQVGFISLPT